jgi:hypothetical protein
MTGNKMVEASIVGEKRYRAFISLPFYLYSEREAWFPRPAAEIASWFSGRHPCSASIDFIPILASRDGRTVGRCAAFVNRMTRVEDHPLGCVGLYECEESGETSAALMEIALAALRSSGCRVAWGPMDGSIWTSYRFMTTGFEGPTFYGEPRNKRWYPAQFAAAGFEPMKTWSTFFLCRSGIERLLSSLESHRRKAVESGYTIRHPDYRRLDEEFRSIHSMVLDAYSGFLGFAAIGLPEFKALYRGLASIWDPDLVQIAVDPEGYDAGFNLVFPDPGRAIRAMKGSGSLLAVFRYLANRDPRAAHVGLYMGARRSAVSRRSGVGALLGHAACTAALGAGRDLIMGLVAQDSFLNSRVPPGVEEIHSYALFGRRIDDGK